MSKLEQLETFIKVVELQGVTPAASARGLTSSAVTKQIQALEKYVGAPLFDRTGRNLKLTEIGARYYQEAVHTLRNIQQLESLIQTNQKEVAGILRVRCMQFVANQRIFPKLAQFLKQYPKLQMRLEIQESIPDFWKDDLDIMYGVAYPGLPDWIRKRIGTSDFVLCASPAYLEQFGTPKIPEDLTQHRHLAHTARNPDYLIRLKDQEVLVPPYLWFNTYDGLIQSALSGLGFFWVHKGAVADLLDKNLLVELLPDYVLRNQPLYLHYQSGRYIDPKIRAFVDFFSC